MASFFQRSLVGGIVSMALLARMDTFKRASGVLTALNWFISRDGTARNRAGFQYVGTVKTITDTTVIRGFDFDDDNTYSLEFGDEYVRIYTDGERLLTGTVAVWSSQGYTVGALVKKGVETFYCCATHDSGKDPNVVAHDNVFWYLLSGTDPDAILELPSPYAHGDVPNVEQSQSADVLTLTHDGYPPYELIRVGATNWTLLPKRFAPSAPGPTGIRNTHNEGNDRSGSDESPVYKVTAINKVSSVESSPGVSLSYDGAIATVADQGLTADIVFADTAHGLETGDEIIPTDVSTTSGTESNQWAVEALADRPFFITKIDADSFSLDGTEGLCTIPSWYGGASWPALTVTYGTATRLAMRDQSPSYPGTVNDAYKLPDPSQSWDIELTWDAVDGAVEYWVYRATIPYRPAHADPDAAAEMPALAQGWGFLAAVKAPNTHYVDNGEIEPDKEQLPPDHPPPFVLDKWPAYSTYHQQRQAYGKSVDKPRGVDASVTGDYPNFTERFPVDPGDKVSWEVEGNDVSELRWLASMRKFLIGTRGGVYVANGDGDGVLTPTSIGLEMQTSSGAGTLRPLLVADTVLFVTKLQTAVRDLRFTIDSDGYGGQNLTSFAPHLFRGYTIVDWAYCENPDSIVWCVRDDGALLSLTYVREHDIWAWCLHDTGATGSFKYVCSIPEGNIDVLYAVVERTINGTVTQYVERMAPRTADEDNHNTFSGSKFLDSFLTYDGTNLMSDGTTVDATVNMNVSGASYDEGDTVTLAATVGTPFPGDNSNEGNGYRLLLADGTYVEMQVDVGGDTETDEQDCTLLTDCPSGLQATGTLLWVRMVDEIDGLTHLEDATVGVCADGHALAEDVVASGELTNTLKDWSDVTTARPYGIVHVGLPITADLQLLDIDFVAGDDPIAPRMKLVNGAVIYVQNTRGIQAGLDADGLQAIDYLGVDGEDGALVTGKRVVTFDSDHTLGGGILIRQSEPLAASVLAVVTHYEVEGNE